jgi:exodeoxyribonuclease VII large subunit
MSEGLTPTSAAASAVSVSELTGHIKAVVEGTFPSLWVAGEISDLSRPSSGHLYFTLKDESAQIRGVMWRPVAQKLPFNLADGQSVLCFGDVEVYAARGTYQIVVRKIQPQGVGALQLAFTQLQAKLFAEGLFDAERKRTLPSLPKRIAIVTSPSGAAIRDFLQAVQNRQTPTEIVVVPASVQGQGAAASIVAGIRAAHALRPRPDVLVVCRGGGSLEDLWCFNEEPVVRAIAASKIPTVSAIGHEIDVTLCDFAADVRALTPTDAATRVLPDGESLRRGLADLRNRMMHIMRGRIESERRQLVALSERPSLAKPREIIYSRYRELDELDARASRAISTGLRSHREQLQRYAASLSALSPLNVLARGYSVTMTLDGKTLTSIEGLRSGTKVRTKLADGDFESVVESQH